MTGQTTPLIDALTASELQPPCMNSDYHGTTPPPATHAVQIRCDHTTGPHGFTCDQCTAQLWVWIRQADWRWSDLVDWAHCGDRLRLWAEPI